MVTIKSRYQNHDPHTYAYVQPTEPAKEEQRTQQQFKAECDVNNIIAKHKKQGINPHILPPAVVADFTQIQDYQQLLDTVSAAQDTFMAMPSHIRNRFNNDPQLLIEFVNEKSNRDEAIKLGLITVAPKDTTMRDAFTEALEINDKKRKTTTKTQE